MVILFNNVISPQTQIMSGFNCKDTIPLPLFNDVNLLCLVSMEGKMDFIFAEQ